jgi:hypothetical protein
VRTQPKAAGVLHKHSTTDRGSIGPDNPEASATAQPTSQQNSGKPFRSGARHKILLTE